MENIAPIYGQKLGLADRPDVLQEAENYALQMNRSQAILSMRLSSSCQSVICLHLAAEKFKLKVDQRLNSRMSGVNGRQYSSILRTVRSFLGKSNLVTVAELSVSLGCPEIRCKAEEVLSAYKLDATSKLDSTRQKDANFDKPLFPYAAIAVAAKLENLKLDRRRLRSESSVLKKEFDEVIAQMEKVALRDLQLQRTSKSTKIKPKTKADVSSDQEQPVVSADIVERKRMLRFNEEESIFDPEEYHLWKKKILRQAAML